MWFGLLDKIVDRGGAIAEARQQLKVAEIEARTSIERARAEAAMKAADHASSWETIAAQGAATSWKDEWFVILLSMPVVLAFVPPLTPYIEAGFIVLELSTPEWFKWSLGAAISFSFGRKTIPNFFRKGG